LVHLARALVEQGAQVDVVLSHARGPFLAEIPASVRVVDLDAPPAATVLRHLVATPGDARALLPVLFLPGVPGVLGAVSPLARYLRESKPDALLSLMDYPNVAAILARREADAVVAVSDGVADDLARVAGLPRERIHRIYNPVLIPEIADLAHEPLDHPAFADDVPVILGAGKLKKQKSFETLVDAFALVHERRPARLMILGKGHCQRRLRTMAQRLGVADDLYLPGFKRNPYPYMRHASVFALSSRYEGFGNVLVEAMACGCPVVSSDCLSGPAEILANGRYGKLTRVDDARGLADAICAVLDDPLPPSELEKRAGAFTAAASAVEYRDLLVGV
jgi:glycosyltransferase involved in cell wall biosynthesis